MHIYIDTVEKSRTAASDKNATAALECLIKQLLGTYSSTVWMMCGDGCNYYLHAGLCCLSPDCELKVSAMVDG